MTHTPGNDGCHGGVESTCPKCSPLARQFYADTAAVEAEYQQHRATIDQHWPGLWEAMMGAVDEPTGEHHG